MDTAFHPVRLEDREAYVALQRASGSRAGDYSFGNIWGWAEHYGLEWRFADGLCWIRQTTPEPRYWAPVGRWEEIAWQKLKELEEVGLFIRVPDVLAALWEKALPGRVQTEETRGQWDYLYAMDDLASLRGNRFHKKKNLLNQFLKLYPEYVYSSLDLNCVENVLDMQDEWRQWHDGFASPSLVAENTAVERVLRLWDVLPDLRGGLISINNRVAAYTVAERLTEDCLVVHFEKGATEFKGIYQAINCLFARQELESCACSNREQDLDDAGLRKAKESYNPTDFVRKNTVRVRG